MPVIDKKVESLDEDQQALLNLKQNAVDMAVREVDENPRLQVE